MAFSRLTVLALFSSLLIVFLGSQNGLSVSGSLLSAGPDEGISPEVLSPPEAAERPRRRANWLQRGLRNISRPIRRIAERFRRILSSRSREQSKQDLRSMEDAANRYFDCFNLSSPETKAARAVTAICGGMKTEAIRRNCSLFAFAIAAVLAKIGECLSQADPANSGQRTECFRRFRLFLVHPLLRESISAASPEDINDAEGWLNSLEFITGPPEELTFPGGSPLGKAFARMNWSLIGTVDNQHILAGASLKESIRVRRGVGGRWKNLLQKLRGRPYPVTETMKPNAEATLTQGFELFVSMPPHPDPLAVRLLTNMLVDGLSCPADGTFGRPERVVVGGKTRTVKPAQMIEAAIYIAVENLFDASDCAAPGSTDSLGRMTCRLLGAYDEFMQSGGPTETKPKTEERLQGIRSAEYGPAPAAEEAEPRNEEAPAPGVEAAKSTNAQSSEVPSNEPSEPTDTADLSGGSEEGPPDLSLELPQEQNLERPFGRLDRIRVYAQQAAASAVATARLSLKLGAATLRIVRLCLRSAFLIRYASRMVLFFMGKELVTKQGLFLFLGRKREGERYLGMHVKALVELSSGNANLANLSAAAAGIAADEETRIISKEQETSVSFIQGWLGPTAVYRALQAAGMEADQQSAVAIALSINVAADVLLACLLVAISTAFSPLLVVLAVVLAVLLIIRSAVISYTVAVPETMMEKLERRGRGAFEKVARVVG